MSGHPPHCVGCDGLGWAPGPPIVEQVNGRPTEYPTLTLCEYPWWRDDPTWHGDPDPVPPEHPKALAAIERGRAQGIAERDAMKVGWLRQTDDDRWSITDRD